MAKRTAKNRRTGPTFNQKSRQVPSEVKALHHQVLGAGRSKVTRKFLGLSIGERERLGAQFRDLVSSLVVRQMKG